jgi:hypothetical protein
VSSGKAWSNWAELGGGPGNTLYQPSSPAKIAWIAQNAQAKRQHIHVGGSGRAFEDCAYSPDFMVGLVGLRTSRPAVWRSAC